MAGILWVQEEVKENRSHLAQSVVLNTFVRLVTRLKEKVAPLGRHTNVPLRRTNTKADTQ